MFALAPFLPMLLQTAGVVTPAHPETEVEQLSGQQPAKPDLSPPNVAPTGKGNNPALVQQLPPGLEAPAERGSGEGALMRGEDHRTLAEEVARAAELLRQRGQQPTPEALAREIGPDTLAAFLSQNPSGLDGLQGGKDKEGTAPALPEGAEGAIVILPSTPGN